MDKCIRLIDLLEEERVIIKRHIKKHQYYTHEADIDKAVIDFIGRYGFVMREAYCDRVCPERKECEAYQQYLRHNPEIEGD